MAQADEVYLEACENYQKGTYRSRCHILGADGLQRLSMPLGSGKNEQMPIKDVRVDYSYPWQAQHLQAMRSAYGKAPFWEYFEADLVRLFAQKPVHLWDWNMSFLRFLWKGFKLTAPILETTDYLKQYPSESRDFRNQVTPKKPLPEGMEPLPRYPQVFEDRNGFVPHLSALDLLLCAGARGLRR